MPVSYIPPTREQLLPVRGISLGTAAAGSAALDAR
jgi:hypothetical protein